MTLIKRDFFATPAVQTVVWDPNNPSKVMTKLTKQTIRKTIIRLLPQGSVSARSFLCLP